MKALKAFTKSFKVPQTKAFIKPYKVPQRTVKTKI